MDLQSLSNKVGDLAQLNSAGIGEYNQNRNFWIRQYCFLNTDVIFVKNIVMH